MIKFFKERPARVNLKKILLFKVTAPVIEYSNYDSYLFFPNSTVEYCHSLT
jgi:hypothetical protein